jgi:tetratricopeptide (TPR) repeat protein
VTTTTNAEAYEAYLKGRQALHERTLKSIQQAQGMFELATALDPDFALAWAGQALAVHLQSENNYGNLGLDETFTRSNALINRALALNPDLGEAHAVRGLGYLDELRPKDALVALDQAVAVSPGVAEFHLWRSSVLRRLGRWKESNEDLDHALQLDPLHPAILVSRAISACTEGWISVTEALTEPLARYPQQLAFFQVVCLLQKGAFADAFTSASASEIDDPFPELMARVALKDCETPWLFASDPGESAFPQALQCEGDKAAMTVYQKLSQDQKRAVRTQAYLSIVQLRQGKYAESLNMLDELYKGSLAGSDLESYQLRGGSHLNLNRVLALQRLGRDGQAASVLAVEREVLERARRDGMRRGYSLLEAKINLLSGNHEMGLQALDRAFREFEVGWYFRGDPVLQDLVGRQKLAEMTQWLDAHIDAERAKLGWPPVGSVGLANTGVSKPGR